MPPFSSGKMADHDHSYKLLFSHAEMVADLIRGFVHEDWVREIDFSTLERVEASFVTRELRERESDIIWRARWGGERWLYVYLLLEFQSTVDPFMALRVLVYTGLLWQSLERDGALSPSGRLPPVLPLVLYNGDRPWSAALDLAELIEEVPGGLERYRPRFRYCLLDEGRIAAEELEPLRNLAAALFRLEKSRDAVEIERVLTALIEWLQAPQQGSLRQAFAVWIVKVLSNRLPGVEIPQVTELQEVKSMLAERVTEWTQQWKQEGFEEGLERGMEKGLEKGLEKGQEKSLERLRTVLLGEMEGRFGVLPESLRGKVAALDSIEEIAGLIARIAIAPSLAELEL
jgi:predicted transposase YdaD